MTRLSAAPLTAGLCGLVLIGAMATAPAAAADDPQSDLAASIKASSSTLLVSSVTFTGTLTNQGPSDTGAAQIEFVYSSGFTGLTAPGCAADTTTRIVACNLGPIPVNGSASKSITLALNPLAIAPNLSVTARLSYSTNIDPNKTNNSATAACTELTTLLVTC